MPSPRRLRLLLVAAFAVTITILFFTSQSRRTETHDSRTIQDFYHKTVNAMDGRSKSGQKPLNNKDVSGAAKAGVTEENAHVKDRDGDGSVDDDDTELAKQMSDRLRAAEAKAKDSANKKAPLKPDNPNQVIGVGSAAGGQKPLGKDDGDGSTKDDETAKAAQELEATYTGIMSQSPIIIFSKSYCPFSKKAKKILLEKYSIDPSPYVVELDKHPLGPTLQEKLEKETGRKTVPNVMINGKTAGGGDEMEEWDSRKTLIDKFKSMGAKRFTMKERFTDKSKDA